MLSTIRAALPAMIEKGTGNIVNVASIGGLSGDFRGSLYGMSKAGVINLTRYVATQFGHKGIQYCTLFRQSRRYSCYNCFFSFRRCQIYFRTNHRSRRRYGMS